MRLGLHTPRKKLTEEYTPEVLALLAAGKTVKEISDHLGISTAQVYAVTKAAGVDLRTKYYADRATNSLTKEELAANRRKYHTARMEKDPTYRAQMKAKHDRAHAAKRAKFAPALTAFRNQACCVCGEIRHAALDAHHRDPSTKVFNIAHRQAVAGLTVELFEEELAKCDCICAYCHRVRHLEEDGPRVPSSEGLSKTGAAIHAARERLAPTFSQFNAAGCQVCGRDNPVGLSAHHYNPATKLFNPSQAVSWRKSDEETQQELDKCTCLCESCHRLVHAGELVCPTPRAIEWGSSDD